MAAQQPLRFGPYRLDGASGQLWRHTQVVHLPPKAARRAVVSGHPGGPGGAQSHPAGHGVGRDRGE